MLACAVDMVPSSRRLGLPEGAHAPPPNIHKLHMLDSATRLFRLQAKRHGWVRLMAGYPLMRQVLSQILLRRS